MYLISYLLNVVHLIFIYSYLHAGADVIITASYQASIDGFVNYCNKTVDEAVQLIKASVDIALSCRDTFWSR